jgi:hypothetical protein
MMADERGGSNGNVKGLKRKITAVFVIIILLLVIIFVGVGIKMITSPPPTKIGKITVDIFKREANVTVELVMDSGIDIEDSDLSLQFSDRELPLTIEGHELSTRISIIEFEMLMELRSANITGEIIARSILPFDISETIRKEIDLSFLADIGDGIEVDEINTTIHSLALTRAEIGFTVDMERDVHLTAENTDADLYASLNVYKCTVENLVIKPDGSGYGSILVPFSAIILLSLSTQNITLEFWGISFEFPFSLSG